MVLASSHPQVRNMTEDQNDLTTLTVQLLSAYVSKNTVASESLAALIQSTRAALAQDLSAAATESVGETFTPSISVRKSLASPDHIISLIDGKPYKTLKRHLARYGLTPDQYRARYGLPNSYPLVARSYSETRRAVAEKNGLGKKLAVGAETVPAQVPASDAKTSATPKASRKGATSREKQRAAQAKADPAPDTTPAVTDAPKAAVAKSAPQKIAKAKDAAPSRPEPAAGTKEARQRLSIAGPKEIRADGKAAVAPKAKPASKPKSLKAALDAASTHLNAKAKAPEAATSES